MTAADPAKPLADLMEPGSTLMVGAAPVGSSPEFRPMTVARVEGDRIDILLDTSEPWAASLSNGQKVTVTLSDNRANNWAAFDGSVSLSRDEKVIDELWNPAAEAFFDDGRDSAGIAVLQIDVTEGRYWSSPSGRLGALIAAVKAKLGSPEDAGESGDLAV